jgi:preprotein translocase subunit YajC
MKSRFTFIVLALLICGLAFAAQENSGSQNTGSQNTMGSNSMSKSTTGMSITGTITKIDTKNHTITVRESSMGSEVSGTSGPDHEQPAGNPGSPSTTPDKTGTTGTMSHSQKTHPMSKGGTHTLKYNTSTRFDLSQTGTGTGTSGSGSINDLKVGDTVMIMRDSSGMITSIQRTTSPVQ